jgi:hypothetical protein
MKYKLGLILLLISWELPAASLQTVDDTKALCEKAVKALDAGKVKQSFEILKPHWPLPNAELDNLAYQTESQLKMAASRFGASAGTDFISTKVAGQSFIQHTFISKFEKHAVRYVCVFYKPKSQWLVNAVNWDDKTPLLFD